MIFIFSMPRSGSTWLGKIFDSHPDVFYLHEPGVDDRGLDLIPSYWFSAEPSVQEIENARLYIKRLSNNRSLRATGTWPVFRKTYRSSPQHIARMALTLAAKGLERFGVRAARRIRIPDLYGVGREKLLVIKSVSAMGLAESFIQAGGSQFCPVFLMRHPCSYVSSMLRGQKLGIMQLPDSPGRLLETRSAKRFGADASALAGASQVELLAWSWLLQNSEAYGAIAATGITIRYEELAAQPIEQTKFLFQKVGLAWMPQTETFLARTTSRDGSYYSTFRNPSTSLHRWRQELDDDAVASIRRIVSKSDLGRSFFVECRAEGF
jgi:hypothetical protein